MNTKYILATVLVSIAIGVGIGYLLFYPKDKKVEVRYEKSKEVIRDTIKISDPYEVLVPGRDIVRNYRDTIWSSKTEYVVQPVDSLKILEDWLTTRKYSLTAFDNDTIGKLTLDATVNKNQLVNTTYEFTPVVKTVTETYNSSRYQLLLGGGIGTNNSYLLQGTVMKGNLGIGYQFNKSFEGGQPSHNIVLTYKLGL